MAGDWIKVQKATARKPEVLQIADKLGVHPDHAFALCVRFWFWCDDNLSADKVQLSAKLLDGVLEFKGFTDALITVGWLRVREGSLEVPNFDRHMSQSAKTRCDSALRKQQERRRKIVTKICDSEASREEVSRGLKREILARDSETCRYCGWSKQFEGFGPYIGATLHIDHVMPLCEGGKTIAGNLVTACSVCNMRKGGRTPEAAGMAVTSLSQKSVTREEKRREEKNDSSIEESNAAVAAGEDRPIKSLQVKDTDKAQEPIPIPTELDTPEFQQAWAEWREHLRQKRKPMKPLQESKQLSVWAANGVERTIAAINHSIANGWQGLFEPKTVATNGGPDLFRGIKQFVAEAEGRSA